MLGTGILISAFFVFGTLPALAGGEAASADAIIIAQTSKRTSEGGGTRPVNCDPNCNCCGINQVPSNARSKDS